MKWPWQRKSGGRLVVDCSGERLAYIAATGGRITRCGVESRGDDNPLAFARRVRNLGLPADDVIAVLRLADCQLLLIDAPAVPPGELKAAARWHIKGMVDAHLDDLTLDVMFVGDGRQKTARRLFVAAANRQVVRQTSEWMQAAGFRLSVIDIRETAQRNLQTAIAAARGSRRANAALISHGNQCLLTICAGGELYFARRLEWDGDLASVAANRSTAAASQAGALPVHDELDIVDYSIESEQSWAAHTGTPPLLIELQRSFDLWERSWPDLPLDLLTVHDDGESDALAQLVKGTLSLPVDMLDVEAIFPGFAAAAGSPDKQRMLRPLLGALLRTEPHAL